MEESTGERREEEKDGEDGKRKERTEEGRRKNSQNGGMSNRKKKGGKENSENSEEDRTDRRTGEDLRAQDIKREEKWATKKRANQNKNSPESRATCSTGTFFTPKKKFCAIASQDSVKDTRCENNP